MPQHSFGASARAWSSIWSYNSWLIFTVTRGYQPTPALSFMTMPRAITHCPNCGQTVTPFAAGCAVCGTDLEAARAARSAKRRIELPSAHWYGARSAGAVDWVHVAIAVLAALAIAPLGLILALYWASRYNRDGERVMTVAMLAVAVLAAAAILAPVWFWSHLLHV